TPARIPREGGASHSPMAGSTSGPQGGDMPNAVPKMWRLAHPESPAVGQPERSRKASSPPSARARLAPPPLRRTVSKQGPSSVQPSAQEQSLELVAAKLCDELRATLGPQFGVRTHPRTPVWLPPRLVRER